MNVMRENGDRVQPASPANQGNRRLRLLHVVGGLGAGGTEMMCLRLARHWRNSFDQTAIALQAGPGELGPAFKETFGTKLSVLEETEPSHTDLYRQMSRAYREHRPDAVLIHCFGVHHLMVAAAARRNGIRKVFAWAGNPPPQGKSGRHKWAAVLLASRLLQCPVGACSSAVANQMRRISWGLANCVEMPYGIKLEADAAPHSKNALGPSPILGMVARLDRIKDQETLLHAFAIVQRKLPSASLWIVGDGPKRQDLEDLALRLGVSIKFLGVRSDVPELLNKLNVYAFSTTRDEGFGIALIEAMSAALPIVATDVPACREVLAAGTCGILVPPADPEAMATAFLDVIQNEDLRLSLVARAYERVQKVYSIEACAKRWEQLFMEPTGEVDYHSCES